MPRKFARIAKLIDAKERFISIQTQMKEYIDDLETKKNLMTKKGDNEFFKQMEEFSFLVDLEKFLIGTGSSFRKILTDLESGLR